MKSKVLKLTSIIRSILLLFIIIPVFSFAQDDVTWDYPVKPGSEEWLNISSYLNRLEQLNIPPQVLSEISTNQLVEICLKYPQIELVFTQNNLIEGISYVSVHFNGFTELFKRSDAGYELLQSYHKFSPSNYKTLDNSGKIQHKKNFIIIEMLLSSPVVLNNMNKEVRFELLKESYNKYEEKEVYWETFYFDQISPNLLIMSRILEIDEPSITNKSELKNEMNILLNSGITTNPAFVTALINEVDNYLNKN